ncbi:MAG: hypothetical protein DRJ63_05505 [Thermoprotei archaeon]|nr:MAG: hypothetical protein DRJ63_05505 [Thermoprotei archaeon]
MKILYYNWIYYPHPLSGGRTLVCRYYAKHMALRGHFVAILTSRYRQTPRIEQKEGYHIYRISLQVSPNRKLNLVKRPVSMLLEKIWMQRAVSYFDLIHVHAPTYGIPLLKWRSWSTDRRPVFITVHGIPPGRGLRNLLYDIEKADIVTAVSEKIAQKIRKLTGRKTTVLPNGVDLKEFKPTETPKNKTPTLIYVSGTAEYKGYKDLLKALQILKKRKIEIKTILLGPGLKRVNHDQMPKYYSKADIFVLPSHREGLSMALLEAMAMELAVIATKVGGISDAVKHMYNGILIEPRNPTELADMIQLLAQNPHLRKKLGKNARKTVQEKYNIEKTINKLEKLYLKYT